MIGFAGSNGRQLSESQCSVVGEVFGKRWMFLIVISAFQGATKFSEFMALLDPPPDGLTRCLNRLIELGVLERRPYRVEGQRQRCAYHLTELGLSFEPIVHDVLAWAEELPALPTQRAGSNR